MTERVKRPAFQWYPGDFRRDLGVQACSFEARALWREMLDLMHDGEPYGHLTAGGVPISTVDLARLVGKTAKAVDKWVGELEARKVFSRTRAGVIYSRRMVRDEDIRTRRAKGGPRSLENENVPRPKDPTKDLAKDGDKDTFDPSLPGSNGGSPAVAVAVAVAVEQVAVVAQALSIRANQGLSEHATRAQPIPRIMPGAGTSFQAAEAILAAGVPLPFAESHVYELARTHAADSVTSLNYFKDYVIRKWQESQEADRALMTPRPNGARPRANGRAMTPGEATHAAALRALEDL